jgi:hypothetical protein
LDVDRLKSKALQSELPPALHASKKGHLEFEKDVAVMVDHPLRSVEKNGSLTVIIPYPLLYAVIARLLTLRVRSRVPGVRSSSLGLVYLVGFV